MTNLIKIALITWILTPTCALFTTVTATAEWPGSGTKPSTVTSDSLDSLKVAEWPGSGTKPS